MSLPPHLVEMQREIRGYAEAFGLDAFEVIFELVSVDQMNMVAAYGGFPTRYPHWRYGMEYEQLSKSHEYGLSKIYELVINTDPCYAYLIESNSIMEQKLVMAHVYGHCDFFKNNYYFSRTNRRMLDQMANHASRIRRYMDRYGVERVESFLDCCLSIENLIDQRALFNDRMGPPKTTLAAEEEPKTVRLLQTDKSYLRGYINPEEFVARRRRSWRTSRSGRSASRSGRSATCLYVHLAARAPRVVGAGLPRHRAGGGLLLRAPGPDQDHERRLGQLLALDDHDHSGPQGQRADGLRRLPQLDHGCAAGPHQPVQAGLELYRHVEERWNKGQFGKEWDECDDFATKKRWDKQTGLGREKVYEVRKLYNDVTSSTSSSPTTSPGSRSSSPTGSTKTRQLGDPVSRVQEIKQKLLTQLTNFGNPIIDVLDGNWENRGELLLQHSHDGVDLQPDWARDTLENLYKLWRARRRS
jgi:stage V sporulation protein R